MLRHPAFDAEVTREQLVDWFRTARARTRELFAIITPEAYYERPIALRNPIVFYEGHLPAFSVNTLAKLALKKPGLNPEFEKLFERGIDPESEAAVTNKNAGWPDRDAVQAYAREADELIEELLRTAELSDDDVPCLRGGEAAFTILEHELMHQETLLYMLHNLPQSLKAGGRGPGVVAGTPARRSTVTIPPGIATLGAERTTFGWDNEFPAYRTPVDEFTIDTHNVTNADWLEYMHATGAGAPHFWEWIDGAWYWRGMFASVPLPHDWPVYVTHEQAAAYARWKHRRLPTEAEWHRAAEGAPIGHADLASFDPIPIGSHAPSAWGVHDLTGNGWEWTSSPFRPFDGFQPMPSYALYSTDFFDDAHYVLKGASPVTAKQLIRPSFRNWFRPNYPYVYATFRTAG